MSCFEDGMAKKRQMECKGGIWILSYGGGVNSSALFFYIVEKKKPLDLVIFADTGEEMQSTYDAVERMKQECLKHNIQFVTVKSHLGRLCDYYISKKSVPSFMKRDCTSKFKISPIYKYIRTTYGIKQKFNMYIGIAFDESHRRSQPQVKYIAHHYPFVDDKITRQGNLSILREHNFPAVKSGCQGCLYSKKYEWITLIRENPNEFNRWLKMDKGNTRYPEVTLCPNFKLEDIEMVFKNQKSLDSFSESPEPECDKSGGCFL